VENTNTPSKEDKAPTIALSRLSRPQQITVFTTSDGSIHKTLEEAMEAEKCAKFKAWYKNNNVSKLGEYRSPSERMYRWLMKNKKTLLVFLKESYV
jgi:hypothetical protein